MMNKNTLLIGGGVAVLATLLFLGKQAPAVAQQGQARVPLTGFQSNPISYNITFPDIVIPPINLPPNPDYGGYGGISACGCPGSASAVPASELPQGYLYSFTPENTTPYLLQSTVPIFPNS